MAELIESVNRHGVISPLTLSRDGDGRYAIIAGERRYLRRRRRSYARCPRRCARSTARRSRSPWQRT
jgi:hypothetical protein